MRFAVGVAGNSHLHSSITLACDTKSLPKGRTTPPPIRIVAALFAVEAPVESRPSGAHSFTTASPERAAGHSRDLLPVDLTMLRTELAAHGCALRVVVFSFPEHAILQQVLAVHPALREPMSDEHTYLFACKLPPRDSEGIIPNPSNSVSVLRPINPVSLQAISTGEPVVWLCDTHRSAALVLTDPFRSRVDRKQVHITRLVERTMSSFCMHLVQSFVHRVYSWQGPRSPKTVLTGLSQQFLCSPCILAFI